MMVLKNSCSTAQSLQVSIWEPQHSSPVIGLCLPGAACSFPWGLGPGCAVGGCEVRRRRFRRRIDAAAMTMGGRGFPGRIGLEKTHPTVESPSRLTKALRS